MIEVEHLSKIYGTTTAIRDVTFTVEPGEILGFLGPNGAGKTTTMRILAGYLPASSGTARVAGYDVHENSMAVRQRIGYLPEVPPLYLEMTVEGFLHFVAQIKGVSAGDRGARVRSAIHRCNLKEQQYTLIRKLSKGYRQRVGIAQAIVHDPPAIILDEPTVGLDPRQIIEVRNLIKNLAGEHTVILSTHILPEVSMTCDRVAIINRGEIITTNSPESLTEQLTGSEGYELEVDGEFLTISQILQSVSGIKQITRLPQRETMTAHPQHCHLQVILEGKQTSGRELAQAIVAAGLGLYEMRRAQLSLEDVFLKLTTEEEKISPPEIAPSIKTAASDAIKSTEIQEDA